MKNLTIKTKLYIILAIGTIGSLLIGLFVNSKFSQIAQTNADINSGLNTINSYIIVLIILDALVVLYVAKQINESVKNISSGLKSFFSFLEYKSESFQEIKIVNNDEIGLISKEINSHALIAKDIIIRDRILLEEIEDVIQKIDNGFFMYQIKSSSPNNKQLELLKNHINTLSKNLNIKMSLVTHALMEYGESNFEYSINNKETMNGAYGSLRAGTRLIRNNVSELLAMILNSGEKLAEDINKMTNFSTHLANSSNEQAASLEETAAALEEIAATITHNTNDIQKMNSLTIDLNNSVREGELLANKTNCAMEDIDTQVRTINEAIAVIDQIAFQTNILSLNAAVEAATAGEAGRGFAVVAGEVRNLANRSAQAAKEIKEIVESATKKADDGKTIANKMILGYDEINNKISETIQLIDNISNASKEQENGIHQITDAVAELDRTTQQNAMEAVHIKDLSLEVEYLSGSLVNAASKAKFPKEKKEQVCDVELVFLTAKLKNDHIRFKENNFMKLGENKTWSVTNQHECALGKWIDMVEKDGEDFTKTKNWNNLKIAHEKVHFGVNSYILNDSKKELNDKLIKIATDIEEATNTVFDTLNQVKIDHCNYKNNL